MTAALFVPCYVDQFYPHVAIAALTVLERLGVQVDVPEEAACCGQPSANAGFGRDGHSTIERFVDVYAPYERIIVLSGSHGERHSLYSLVLGANSFITKPASSEALVREIARLVRRRREAAA
jgi:Fe-S oxidoreductase